MLILNQSVLLIFKKIGSGAIAQVHLGRLKNNELVAIKVLHPNIHNLIETDCKF